MLAAPPAFGKGQSEIGGASEPAALGPRRLQRGIGNHKWYRLLARGQRFFNPTHQLALWLHAIRQDARSSAAKQSFEKHVKKRKMQSSVSASILREGTCRKLPLMQRSDRI